MTLTLPRFQASAPLVDENGMPTAAFHIWWDTFAKNIEASFNSLSDQVAAIAAAQAAAEAAQASADVAASNDKLTASSVIPASVLGAIDAGSSTSITVSDHTRVYGNATQVAITGATITGLNYATTYAVYYDDPTRSLTTPTFIATQTLSNALNNFVQGRHFMGVITTPAVAAPATSGGSVPTGTDPTFKNRFDTL